MLHAAIINFRRRIVNRTRGFSCRAAAQFNPGLEVLRWDSGGAMVALRPGPGVEPKRPILIPLVRRCEPASCRERDCGRLCAHLVGWLTSSVTPTECPRGQHDVRPGGF